jgi:teichuronic acid biosynthesis glycosyltransferase TuaH
VSARARQPLHVDGDLVVMVPGNPWDGNRFGQHHVAAQLARRVTVLWVDPQISYLTPLNDPGAATALREDRLRRVAPNILRLTPVTVPGVTRPILREVAVRQARRAVRRAVERLGARVHTTIVAGLSDMLDVVPGAQRVFFGTDDYVAGAALMGTDPRWLAGLEARQLTKAEIVVAISPVLQEKWSARRPDVTLVPNGCDAGHFATADAAPLPADVELEGPIAGFVGHMSERIDLSMLEAVAASGVSLLLVGPRQPTFEIAKLDALLARPNVQWVGNKPFAELPSYLRVIDVGLTPYQQSDFNHASFPLKTLEYLAAGRPAVVSDLPAHRWLQTPHVTIATTAQDFAARTQALLAAPSRRQDGDARRAFAQQHSWAARADDIARLLGLDGVRATTTPAKAA